MLYNDLTDKEKLLEKSLKTKELKDITLKTNKIEKRRFYKDLWVRYGKIRSFALDENKFKVYLDRVKSSNNDVEIIEEGDDFSIAVVKENECDNCKGSGLAIDYSTYSTDTSGICPICHGDKKCYSYIKLYKNKDNLKNNALKKRNNTLSENIFKEVENCLKGYNWPYDYNSSCNDRLYKLNNDEFDKKINSLKYYKQFSLINGLKLSDWLTITKGWNGKLPDSEYAYIAGVFKFFSKSVLAIIKLGGTDMFAISQIPNSQIEDLDGRFVDIQSNVIL